jgi:hypothetical protein
VLAIIVVNRQQKSIMMHQQLSSFQLECCEVEWKALKKENYSNNRIQKNMQKELFHRNSKQIA